ncbi:hypothetical protein QWO28_002351 [Escherichia coli]|uniref:hypothetical protein n=1 Tax=Enterobacteriaceae TaxID=543 RepID=UPI000A6C2CC8|nr:MULTISPECIES: hypothetical protein [Enterobacteriaceae]ELO3132960.1 hypothetical protein [Escherichia coli]ELO3141657.1 hypothetical protein [Escherichia coli]
MLIVLSALHLPPLTDTTMFHGLLLLALALFELGIELFALTLFFVTMLEKF